MVKDNISSMQEPVTTMVHEILPVESKLCMLNDCILFLCISLHARDIVEDILT